MKIYLFLIILNSLIICISTKKSYDYAIFDDLLNTLNGLESRIGFIEDQLGSLVSSISKSSHTSPIMDDGSGWIILMKSGMGNVDFDRGWNDYKIGFGSLGGDYWLGLEEMHKLTNEDKYQLQVDIQHYDDSWRYAIYDKFLIKDEMKKYKLRFGSYNKSSTESDGLSYHNGCKFSTFDDDNDGRDFNCANLNKSGWWYHKCYRSKLTGIPFSEGINDGRGIIWNGKSVKSVIMKMKRL